MTHYSCCVSVGHSRCSLPRTTYHHIAQTLRRIIFHSCHRGQQFSFTSISDTTPLKICLQNMTVCRVACRAHCVTKCDKYQWILNCMASDDDAGDTFFALFLFCLFDTDHNNNGMMMQSNRTPHQKTHSSIILHIRIQHIIITLSAAWRSTCDDAQWPRCRSILVERRFDAQYAYILPVEQCQLRSRVCVPFVVRSTRASS